MKMVAESATTQIRVKKSWWRKMPSKWKSDGGKCRQTSKMVAKSATTQIRVKKVMVAESAIKMEKWWRKMPPNQKSDGKKCHHFSNLVEQCGGFGFWIFRFKIRVVVKSGGFIALWWNFSHHISSCGGIFTTTYHIQGAGAPAKTRII